MTDLGGGRHLTLSRLHEYLHAGARAVVQVDGDPAVSLVIDGSQSSVAVETPWDGVSLPDLSPYEHLSTDVVFHDGLNWARFEVTGALLLDDAYPLLVTLVDHLQLEREGFSVAVTVVLDGFRELFARTAQLTRDQEVGLYGELLVLERLIQRVGAAVAVQAWLGPDAAEHDFALLAGDIEVKTTTGELRQHWIHGLGQLQPLPNRDLYLLSLQITAAGASPGRTLAELITELRAKLATQISALDAELHRLGWRDRMADHGLRRLRLRSEPFCVHVADLPALTTDLLAGTGIDVARIGDVSYRIDVTGLPEAAIATDDFAPIGGP